MKACPRVFCLACPRIFACQIGATIEVEKKRDADDHHDDDLVSTLPVRILLGEEVGGF